MITERTFFCRLVVDDADPNILAEQLSNDLASLGYEVVHVELKDSDSDSNPPLPTPL